MIAIGSVAAFVCLRVACPGKLYPLNTAYSEHYFTWIQSGFLNVGFDLFVDRLTAVMLLVVTGVGLLIHIYAIGYMAHEGGYYRFFSYFNLFMFFMLILVLASNLLLMFVGWEGVGLCSYLLVGFYFLEEFAGKRGQQSVHRKSNRRFRFFARHISDRCGIQDTRFRQGCRGRFKHAGRSEAGCFDCDYTAAFRGRHREIGSIPFICLVAGRNGRSHTCIRSHTRRNYGHGRRIHDCPRLVPL